MFPDKKLTPKAPEELDAEFEDAAFTAELQMEYYWVGIPEKMLADDSYTQKYRIGMKIDLEEMPTPELHGILHTLNWTRYTPELCQEISETLKTGDQWSPEKEYATAGTDIL